jgi:hypothetical protein
VSWLEKKLILEIPHVRSSILPRYFELNYDIDTPTVNSKTREGGDDLKDLYRKTLAAQLTSQDGVPDADQVIEDIFAGGDGWCGVSSNAANTPTSSGGRKYGGSMIGGSHDENGNWSDDGSSGGMRSNKRSWPDFQISKKNRANRGDLSSSTSRASFAQGSQDMDREYGGSAPELDELEAREDLRCWNYAE